MCSVCLRVYTWFCNLYVKMTRISRQQYSVLTEGAKQQNFGVKILRIHDSQVRTQTVGPYITLGKRFAVSWYLTLMRSVQTYEFLNRPVHLPVLRDRQKCSRQTLSWAMTG